MIQNTVGYPDLVNLNKNTMSLETAGIVATPNFFTGAALATQKDFFNKGFQGMGDAASIFNTLDTGSATLGGISVIGLVAIGIGVYFISSYFSADSQRKRNRTKYTKEVGKLKQKYQIAGRGE